MKRLSLVCAMILATFFVDAQYLKIYHHQWGEADSSKYCCDDIKTLDYELFDDYMMVLFSGGGGDDYKVESIDSLCFSEVDPDMKYVGTSVEPIVKMQFLPENATISMAINENRYFNVTVIEGSSPLKLFEIYVDGVLLGEAPIDDGLEVVNFNFYLAPIAEDKSKVELVATDEAGQKGKTSFWMNSIFLDDSNITVPDCFAYYPNSWFRFWKDSGDETKGTQETWNVKDYDHSTGIATIVISEKGDSVGTLKLKRNHETGALETGGGSNLTDPSKKFEFLYGYRTSVPSTLLGSMKDDITCTKNSDGSLNVITSTSYKSSRNDRFGYAYELTNTYTTGLGFTNLKWYSRNDQVGQSATFHSNMKLIAYYIEQPNGSFVFKESDVPPAPVITGVAAKNVMRDVWTQRYTVEVPNYTFTYDGSTVIDFIIWHYDATSEEFVQGPPDYMYTYYWMSYNSNYKKVPNFGYNVEKGKREFTLIPRSADGWGSNHKGNHYMVLTGRNAAGFGTASNIFTLVVENGNISAGVQNPSPSPSRLRSSSVDDKVNDAYMRLMKKINMQEPNEVKGTSAVEHIE